jgi:transposase
VGWISALPWNQAPPGLRERATEELPPCSAEQPGVRAVAEKLLVHGQEYLAVLKYSAPFAAEQLHSLTTSISRTLPSLRRFSKELNKPRSRWTEEGMTRKIEKCLSGQFLSELIRYQLESRDGQWRLQFDFDQAAFERLLGRRLGRTVLLTNRMDWTAEQVVVGYAGQQQVERVFRGLKDGEWLAWGPMHHWTDRKIRIHAFYCMLGISLLQYVHRQALTQSRLDRSFHGTTPRRVATDSAVRSALSTARRKRFPSRCLCALEANFGAAGFGQGAEAGPVADYPPWVIPTGRLKLHKKELLGTCRSNPQ